MAEVETLKNNPTQIVKEVETDIDAELSDLKQILLALPELKRKGILKKIELFSQSDAKPDNIDPNGFYKPVINKYDFVHVDFTGVGGEWDGAHYGLVWNVNPKFESFTIIPTTSQQREEYANVFPIGKVLGLPNGVTTLLVGDMTKISRKRVTPVTFRHHTRGIINSRLKEQYIPRIQEAVAVTYGGQVTFETFLRENTKVAMPEDLSPLYAWRFKPIVGRYVEQSNELQYRLWTSDQWHSLKMINPNRTISKNDKKAILRGLFSQNQQDRVRAEWNYHEFYKKPSTT